MQDQTIELKFFYIGSKASGPVGKNICHEVGDSMFVFTEHTIAL
jgi:hypothetical protein